MADKTFGVKVSDEMYERAKLIIDSSGVSSKEWFEKAVALYEMNSIKQGSNDYTQDLTELEHHTTRIYDLIVNMIQRSIYLKDHAVKEVAEKLESKESIINDFQQQIAQLKEDVKTKAAMIADFETSTTELTEKLKASELNLANNQALITEYKEKNDSLSGLVVKYQSFAEENESLKAEKVELQEDFNAKQLAVAEQIKSLKNEVNELTKALKDAETQHEQALAVTIDRKDVEREKALIELERQHQAAVSEMQRSNQEQINTLNAKHTEQVRSLYAELAELRKQTDEMREKHQQEIAALKDEK